MKKLTRTAGVAALAVAFALGGTAATQAAPRPTEHAHSTTQRSALADPAARSALGVSAQEATEALAPRLDGGREMTANQYLLSESGQFALSADGFYGHEYGLVLDGPSTFPEILTETKSTNPAAVNLLAMQTDGNLVLYTDGKATWSSGTFNNPGAYLVLQNDRNLVIYSAAGKALWSSATYANSVDAFQVSEGAWSGVLAPGWYTQSPDGRYKFVMQGDGNAVLYFGNKALWSSGSSGNPNSHFALQSDGNMVVYSAEDAPKWQSRTNKGVNADYRLVVQNDGNMVLYQTLEREQYKTARALWSSGTGARR